MRVGLGWAKTTHLDVDMGVGPGFEEAGAWLLKACAAAGGSLATAALGGAAAGVIAGAKVAARAARGAAVRRWSEQAVRGAAAAAAVTAAAIAAAAAAQRAACAHRYGPCWITQQPGRRACSAWRSMGRSILPAALHRRVASAMPAARRTGRPPRGTATMRLRKGS